MEFSYIWCHLGIYSLWQVKSNDDDDIDEGGGGGGDDDV